jgi:hypothetical protein
LKDAFAGVLSQRAMTTLAGGRKVTCLHPLGFASKWTSIMEEKYKLFLLEFALLKFCFDKFADILWGMPVEVEIDCQVLWDVLLSDKLNATHARWRDGILAYNIVNVHHISGVTNIADGVSRQYEGTPKGFGDGSEWMVSPDIDDVTGIVQDIFQIDTLAKATAVTNFLYLITLRHPDSVLLIADVLRHPQLVLVINDSSLTRLLTYLFSAC